MQNLERPGAGQFFFVLEGCERPKKGLAIPRRCFGNNAPNFSTKMTKFCKTYLLGARIRSGLAVYLPYSRWIALVLILVCVFIGTLRIWKRYSVADSFPADTLSGADQHALQRIQLRGN